MGRRDAGMGQRGQHSCGITGHSESGSEATRRPRSLGPAPLLSSVEGRVAFVPARPCWPPSQAHMSAWAVTLRAPGPPVLPLCIVHCEPHQPFVVGSGMGTAMSHGRCGDLPH